MHKGTPRVYRPVVNNSFSEARPTKIRDIGVFAMAAAHSPMVDEYTRSICLEHLPEEQAARKKEFRKWSDLEPKKPH